ncbi:hypothetical protein A2755_00635 [Candidatus Wolfebacteria bacterium RIFCSPHIGHO2_01_FULL_48_22]|uniref:Uncharacterized protein n=2 Tax=Candidatus Wolfeibacteriota TaxID=1752735 RepID=A0A1F8DTA0_9BACT|nr:MAG: hypothetical protein A2755_00635 [Candidatus Wolfebacteria bacterium RIFCSPHIGHO2_01_FULL_48_22]OGM94057.1 MAG: hypothetical protein A2935_02765 [Candidatus Wolfebacteria bacterium RIFCSPLOWO2_01_FULL_47_17b]
MKKFEGPKEDVSLAEYVQSNPERLEHFKDVLGGFSFEQLESECEHAPRFLEKFKKAVMYAVLYTEKVIRMEQLAKSLKYDAASRDEMEQLILEQSDDKDICIRSLEELHEDMQKDGIQDALGSLFGKSSTFNTQLALYVAFSSISKKSGD